MRLGFGLFVACVLAWGPLAGCGDDDGGSDDAGMGDGSVDDAGPTDASTVPDGARLCEEDTECDDGVFCTRDFCDPLGFCRNPVDIATCDDGVFCNGVEQCDPLRGCVPGPPETCNDSDVCTLDRCDEEAKTCRHAALDFDEDGEIDWHCDDDSGETGTDCDDRDPTRGALLAEICDDTVDNDCDEMIDEATCGAPPHDSCDDPLDVSAGGAFTISSIGARADYGTTCGSSSYRDVVLTLTLTEPKDVTITADGTSGTALALRTTCDDMATELECESWFPGQIRSRALAAGTYFVIVKDWSVGEIFVNVELEPPTTAPSNETCASPIDVSAGGSFTGSTVDVADDLTTSCGFGAAPDLVYTFTTTAPQNVYVSLLSETGDTEMNFSVRSACSDATTELRCLRGTVAYTTLHELPAGTYYIIAEGPSYREVEYTLEVRFNPPSPPPPGDSCSSPIPLPLDTMTLGSLADKQDDHSLACSGSSYRDAVYAFTLTERRDVTVTVNGGTTFMYASVRAACADSAMQLRCASGNPSRSTIRDLPAGTYYVLVESYRGTGFNISVETSTPTAATPVSANENCTTAYVVPATGGLFSGTTTGMVNDYTTSTCGASASAGDAVFRIDLTTTKRVIASTSGSAFDTVLHVHEGMCTSGGESYCDDDGVDALASLIDETLGAGTWYFVVDGWGGYTGDYYFEAMILDP